MSASISMSTMSTEANRTGSWKYIQPSYRDKLGPCQLGCPTAVDVPGYMALLREGRIDDACDVLLLENPIPAITGRVCNHPCESECNRDGFDGAVAIHAVERMLGDHILARPLPRPIEPQHTETIAVVGSGPAGLASAYHLARLGYHVDVFEQEEQPGGMLRVGIPEYRLPRDILDAQVERISALGVRFNCGVRIGADISWERLTTQFAAVFIAIGAHVSKSLGVDVPPVRAVWSGLDFLRTVNCGEQPVVGHEVVVVGGGNTAMDCARTATRLGARVTVLYRRTRAEMPAIAEEISDAEREGVRFEFLGAPARVAVEGARLGITCTRMVLGAPDAKGRRTVQSSDARFDLYADTLITAIGEDGELALLPPEIQASEGRCIDEWGETRVANIFMGGDAAGDNRTVASALGAGKRAAIGIDRYLRSCRGEHFTEELIDMLTVAGTGGLSMARWTGADPVGRRDVINDVVAFEDINTTSYARIPRNADRRSEYVLPFTESNIGLGEEQALREAGRCFQCGLCNSCELCMIYCSDAAITRADEGRFDIKLDYCKGCGVCAAECPRGCITMTREGL